LIPKKEIIIKANEWQVIADTVDKDYVLGHFFNETTKLPEIILMYGIY
jgi:hypothetical protein